MSDSARTEPAVEDVPSPASRLIALFSRHRLSPTQRLIARYVIEHPHEAPFLSSVELATRTGVSQPSVTRLATSMGCDGYPALQRVLREAVVAEPVDGAASGNKYQRAVASQARNLHALVDALAELDALHDCAARMADSAPLPTFGLRVSAPLAAHFGYFAAKIHPDVRVITEGGSTAVDHLSQARRSGAHTLLAVVLPRYPRETFSALAAARDLGYHIVVVADRRNARLDQLADVTFPAAVGTELVFDLHIGPLMVLTALLDAMADVDPSTTQAELEAFEQLAVAHDFFLEG